MPSKKNGYELFIENLMTLRGIPYEQKAWACKEFDSEWALLSKPEKNYWKDFAHTINEMRQKGLIMWLISLCSVAYLFW